MRVRPMLGLNARHAEPDSVISSQLTELEGSEIQHVKHGRLILLQCYSNPPPLPI